MDPITAFGLAGTILQFIDSGIKFTKVLSSLYNTGDAHSDARSDAQESVFELIKLTEAFNDVLQAFGSSPVPSSKGIEGKKDGLVLLADECVDVTKMLLHRLRKAGFPEKPPSRKRDVLKTALKSTFFSKDIDAIKSRLNGFRDQFNFHLLVSLRQYATQSFAKQEETLQALNITSQNSRRLEAVTDSILNHLTSKAMFTGGTHWQMDIRTALVAQIYGDTETSTRNTACNISLTPETRVTKEKAILSTLKYHGMQDRQGRIPDTYKSTFEWVLSEGRRSVQNWQMQSLRLWLESDEQVYWISGKAGSGKSTLMKYLCEPVSTSQSSPTPKASSVSTRNLAKTRISRCHPYLEKWAGSQELVLASFYFWVSDARGLQKSYAGLLRTLLYQILLARPELIPIVLPSRWEALSIFGVHPELSAWTDNQLQHALEVSVDALTTEKMSKVCFFIDGLDEFEGKSTDLVKLVQSLAQQAPNTKFCVASRPWVDFQDAFDTNPHLRLEDLNYGDIKFFVTTKLGENPEFAKLCGRQPQFADDLVENIVSKASGVFLWVHLVVTSLLSGMSFGDRIEDLQRRLDLLPPDLENLYDRMLRGLDEFYLEHAAQLILLMEASTRSLPLIVLSLADEETVASLRKLPNSNTTAAMVDLRLDSMTRRLNSRWKGMLEIDRATGAATTSGRAHRTVQYLHRTVRDFIQSDRVQQFLESSIKSPFDPHLQLCIAWCAYPYMKTHHSFSSLVEPDRVLHHAAMVLNSNEMDMLEVVDQLSEVAPATQSYRSKVRYTRQEILSMAVTFPLVAYVKARLTSDINSTLLKDLLIDAVVNSKHLDGQMIKLLLDAGADVDSNMNLAWRRLLERIGTIHPRPIKTLAVLDDASRIAMVAMVANGAHVDEARGRYVGSFKNRFGKREITSETIFTDSFFDELKALKVSRKSNKVEQVARWFKGRRGP